MCHRAGICLASRICQPHMMSISNQWVLPSRAAWTTSRQTDNTAPADPLLLSAKDSPPQWGMHALSKPQVGTTTRLHSFGREINLFVPVIKRKETKTWEKVRKSRRILSVGKHNKCQVVPAWSWYTCALYSVLPHVTTSSKAAKWEIMVAIKHYSHTHSVTPDVS